MSLPRQGWYDKSPRGAGLPLNGRLVPPSPLVPPSSPGWGWGVPGPRGRGAALVKSGSRVRELVREMALELVYWATRRKKGRTNE